MEQPDDPVARRPSSVRTLILRILRDEHNKWHVAVSEPSSSDGWRVTADGLNAAWQAVLRRLRCSETNDSRQGD